MTHVTQTRFRSVVAVSLIGALATSERTLAAASAAVAPLQPSCGDELHNTPAVRLRLKLKDGSSWSGQLVDAQSNGITLRNAKLDNTRVPPRKCATFNTDLEGVQRCA